jgi:hypothetical protein
LKRRPWLRRLVGLCLLSFLLLLVLIGVEAASSWYCDLQGEIHPPVPQPQKRKALTAGIKDYGRPEDDTYLSYPEWYIVWSYQEKADVQENGLPSAFPYFGAVRQYWNSYACISRLTRGKYAFNGGEHLMLVVIGTSFSAEYLLKGVYEKTIGRLSEMTSAHQPVEEDLYAYRVAREYADFVHVRPFYEFHFARQVKGLWSETHFWGAHPLRKLERKVFLTVDYAIEAFYCCLIEKATHATYGHEPAETSAWIDNTDETLFQQVPSVRKLSQVGPRSFLVEVPRYQEFTSVASSFVDRGVQFEEIAGNSQIIVSVLAPQSWHYDGSDARQLFSIPILTHPELKRIVLGCDVTSLSAMLSTLQAGGITAEHVYDY